MNPWTVLGLKPGADRAEIRRAYARLLKTTNPEDDPEGFMRLREAHDAALNQLQWRQQWPDAEADETPAAPPPEPLSAPAEDPQLAAERDDLLARQEALLAAIAAGADGQRAAFDALRAAPALDGVAARAEVEAWLTRVIAASLPASDPLVVPAIDQFGWDDLPRGSMPPAVAALLQRREEGEFVAGIARPHTDLHVGYMALSKPPGPRWLRHFGALFSAAPAQTRTILGLADGPLPGILDWLDPAAVAAWRDWHSVQRLRLWMIVTMFPLAAVVLVGLVEASGWPQPLQQGAGLLAWAAPFGLLAVLRWRQRWLDQWDRPEWQYTHWPLAIAALPLLAALWPALPLVTPLFLLPVLAAMVWMLLALDRLEPLAWREFFPGLIRSQPAWLPLLLLISGGIDDANAPVRVLACAALAVAWWQGGDGLAWTAERRFGQRAPWLLAAVAAGVAMVAAALPLLPFDRLLLAGRGLALLPLALLVALIGFRVAQGWQQWLSVAVLVGLGLALFWLLDVIDPRPAQTGSNAPAGLAGPAARMLLLASIILALNWWRNRGRRNNHYLLVATLVSFVLGVVLAGRDDDGRRQAPPRAPVPASSGAQPPRAIGDRADWIQLMPAASAAPPGRYRLEARLQLGPDGTIAGCRLQLPSGIKPLDATACLQLMARGRFSPARDIKGKPQPAVEFYRLEWTMKPAAPATAPPPPPEPVIRCPAPAASSGPMVAEPCMETAWIPEGAYPPAAARRGESGLVRYRLFVDTAGRVERCAITLSSGHAGLDSDTCALLVRRARFVPARDVDGSAMAWEHDGAVRWTLTAP